MHIDIISAVPALLSGPFGHSIMKRAQEKNILSLHIHDLHNYSNLPHRQIDDYAYGGSAGMVLMAAPLAQAIETLSKEYSYDAIIYFAPDGLPLTQKICNTYSLKKNLLLICGHYKGIDQRIRDTYITHEISIGEYVISGGELAAAVFVDSIVRLIPNVLSNETSALCDSFQDGYIAPPVYTRPAIFKNMTVPEVLLQGNHKAISEWEWEHAQKATENYHQKKNK